MIVAKVTTIVQEGSTGAPIRARSGAGKPTALRIALGCAGHPAAPSGSSAPPGEGLHPVSLLAPLLMGLLGGSLTVNA